MITSYDGFDLLLLICPNFPIIHATLFEIEVHLTSELLNSTERGTKTTEHNPPFFRPHKFPIAITYL